MRVILILVLILAVAPFVVGFGPPGIVESDQARAPLYASQVPLIEQSAPPTVSAAAAVAVDGDTGQVIFDKNAHAHRAPASMTKVTTAIVALERGSLQDQVHITVNGWAMEGSSVMGITPGETLPLQSLLVGLLVPSGNDAALAIAEQIGGTTEQFVEMMNAKVAELGLKDTHFVNPHGLDDPSHYSSAYDIAMLARYAMRYPAFADIVKMRVAVIEGHNATYQMKNTNPLLDAYNGADGVKTGSTDAAGSCVVGSATKDGRRMFVTLMDDNDRLGDGTSLFDYAFDNFGDVSLAPPASPLFAVTGLDGQQHSLRLADTQRLCLPRWQLGSVPSEFKLSVDPDRVVDPRQQVGELIFYPWELPPVHVPLYVAAP